MKRFLMLAGCMITFTCACFAQDVIVTRDSRKIEALVIQVNEDNVRYKRYEKPNGPTFVLQKSDIVTILYQNGNVETFEASNPGTQRATSTPVQRPVQSYQPQQQTQRATQPNPYQTQNQRTAQSNQYSQYQDAVYLKNGSVIRGVIIEQIPNISIKIETTEGNIFVFRMDEIESISKIPVQTQRTAQTYNPYRTQQTTQYDPYYNNSVINYSRMKTEAPELYQLYQSGKHRGGTGWFFIIAGIVANGVGIGLIADGNSSNSREYNIGYGYITTVAGDVLLCIGIPIAIGGKVRRVKAKKAYEQFIRYGEEKPIEPYLKLNVNGNGVGLAYVF
ncbi:MAG: hypothetical protein LBE56_01995 [Tannerella sp.]|jgi:hypothetical protein|nr:hypothetical protein [Tannerella sp.]